jgi:hypothetical protein
LYSEQGPDAALRASTARRPARGFGIGLAAVLALSLVATGAQGIERRKDQFPREPSYLVLPLPYSLPGIGQGVFVPVFFSNIAGSYVDAYALGIFGDATGFGSGVEDIHLVERHLILDLFVQQIDKAAVNIYDLRGMDTKADQYSIIELSRADYSGFNLALTFWERRLELFVEVNQEKVQIDRIRDSQGTLLAELTDPYRQTTTHRQGGLVFDYTDDRQDPRAGVRLSVLRSVTPARDPSEPEFYTTDYAVTAYLPVGRLSTIALHAFRSDARVVRPGDTDPASVAAKLGIDCAGDPACQKTEAALVQSIIDANRNGTSTSLGGEQRLRGYPGGRFQGAHTLYYATELRINLTEEFTPFDYFVWKDVRTGVQLALFAEQGSVSETSGTLGDRTRSDYGVGLRMVAGSGEVYRLDWAQGDEGAELTVIVDYPF